MTDRQVEIKQAIEQAVSAFNSATYAAREAGLEVIADLSEFAGTGRLVLGATVLPEADGVDEARAATVD